MLYNYLIFLCIGIYASCNPITPQVIPTSIWEIQRDFCEIKEELHNHLQNSKEIRLDIPESRKGACARFNLNTYIQLLNHSSMKITQENVTTRYNNMLDHLKTLAETWPAKDGKNCPTAGESNLKLPEKLHVFLLQTLPDNVCLHKTTCPPHFSVNESCLRKLNDNSK